MTAGSRPDARKAHARSHALTWLRRLGVVAAIAFLLPSPAAAYVGPGAGIAFVTSFLVVFVTGVIAVLSIIAWPFRMLWAAFRKIGRAKPRVRRLIVVGFDGQDPRLTDQFMEQGRLPNFERLARMGSYHRLATTTPALSPVAWSSFSTGTNPGKHNIFDFLDRDLRTYLPVLSSAHIGKPKRVLKLGKYRVPLGQPPIRLLRKSKPFWSILGEAGIWSTVLRVPITFPPDRFHGAQLAAMSVPDLLGSQGTFTFFSTRPSTGRFQEGGIRVQLTRTNGRIETQICGPPNSLVEGGEALEIPLAIEIDQANRLVHLGLGDEPISLPVGQLSDWIELKFRVAPGLDLRGICRMMVTEIDDHFSLYVTPINIDPEKPAMPISHPSYYASYLSKKLGKFATLGLAEDTWSLNEGVVDEGTFLTQAYDIDAEREDMLFNALDALSRGTAVCVFDATDRIQHMFWRYLGKSGPGVPLESPPPAKGAAAESNGQGRATSGQEVIAELYERNDAIVGRVLDRLRDDDVLMVLSDHGFSAFRRGFNPNAWLLEHGYLALEDGADGGSEWLRDVDWKRTRAYAIGLTGIFLNLEGREAHGIVHPSQAAALKAEIRDGLRGLVDPEGGNVAIRDAFDRDVIYHGPYTSNAPDLLLGCSDGYRISWNGAMGVVAGPVFEDNVKAWSGDHCVDPALVPGVLFSSRPVAEESVAIVDLAPTALWLFGLAPPGHMDGKVLFREEMSGGLVETAASGEAHARA